MYQVSDHTRSQFEKMLGLASVKEALAFIEANQPEAIEEQKELVLIEAPTGHEENRAKVFAEKFKALGLEDVHTDRGGNVIGIRPRNRKGAEGADRGPYGYRIPLWDCERRGGKGRLSVCSRDRR